MMFVIRDPGKGYYCLKGPVYALKLEDLNNREVYVNFYKDVKIMDINRLVGNFPLLEIKQVVVRDREIEIGEKIVNYSHYCACGNGFINYCY